MRILLISFLTALALVSAVESEADKPLRASGFTLIPFTDVLRVFARLLLAFICVFKDENPVFTLDIEPVIREVDSAKLLTSVFNRLTDALTEVNSLASRDTERLAFCTSEAIPSEALDIFSDDLAVLAKALSNAFT
jgi:hypothetical protein